jgi:hypothetical protein
MAARPHSQPAHRPPSRHPSTRWAVAAPDSGGRAPRNWRPASGSGVWSRRRGLRITRGQPPHASSASRAGVVIASRRTPTRRIKAPSLRLCLVAHSHRPSARLAVAETGGGAAKHRARERQLRSGAAVCAAPTPDGPRQVAGRPAVQRGWRTAGGAGGLTQIEFAVPDSGRQQLYWSVPSPLFQGGGSLAIYIAPQ